MFGGLLCGMCCYKFCHFLLYFIFFFKQKTAYEMRISDWSSDVCSSDLPKSVPYFTTTAKSYFVPPLTKSDHAEILELPGVCAVDVLGEQGQIGRASCRERVCQYV